MKGIFFKPWKIKAIADSSPEFEWQTRRLAGLEKINQEPDKWERIGYDQTDLPGRFIFWRGFLDTDTRFIKPRYRVGEVVYIKEAYSHYADILHLGCWTAKVKYKLDGEVREIPFAHTIPLREKWWNKGLGEYFQSPLFMPAWAAHYFVKILDVRAERLQEITLQDLWAEGMDNDMYAPTQFELLWDSINLKYPWASNPWCFVYNFQLVDKPVSTC